MKQNSRYIFCHLASKLRNVHVRSQRGNIAQNVKKINHTGCQINHFNYTAFAAKFEFVLAASDVDLKKRQQGWLNSTGTASGLF